MKKKIASSLLAAGLMLSTTQPDSFASSSLPNEPSTTGVTDENTNVIDFESSLRVIGQTDNSISIEWDKPGLASKYSVFVNGDSIAENIESTKYNVEELESASEYFISVSAFDENGKLLFESNEICAHTNLTINSNYTLTKDINAANVFINGGMFDLNGHSLTVDGDVWLNSGYLNVNKGKLYIGGDFNLKRTNYDYGYGYLTMQNAEDYILVNGNMCVASIYNNSTLTAGTIELKGDFTQITYSSANNFYCSGSHKVILSGEGLQTVSFASTQSQFNTLDVQNFSEDGVVFSTAATVVELLDNGCNVSFANGERSGWTLEEDETIDGDLNLSRGTLDLNGHRLTVTGNLIQSGGNVLVNGGELDVQGDYRVQALNGGKYTVSPGTLTMKNDSDTVKVGGEFVMQSTKSHSELLSAGTLEIGGDLTQLSGGSSYNLCTSGTHTVVLNGSEKQTISIANNDKKYSRIANLKIENNSSEGVDIASQVYILGKLYNTDSPVTSSKNLYITATTEFPDSKWNYDANFVEQRTIPAGLEIGGSLYVNSSLTLASDTVVGDDLSASGNLNLNGYTLTVDGDVWLNSGYLNVNKGKLYIGGDFNLKRTNYDYGYGYLTMQNAEDYILVNGNMCVASIYNNSTLTAGTIELKGDFTQITYSSANNFYCSGSHKVILSGEGLQTVSFASTQSQFNIIEIRKPLDIGYIINSNTKWNELVENYTDDSAPAAPTNLQFVRSTSTSVMMRWTDSEDIQKLNCYEIYRDGKLVGTTKQTEFIDNGLNTHTQYEYHIVALGANGVRSESSNIIQAATDVDAYAPTTPTGLQAVIRTDGSVYLTWTASSDNVSVDGYNLYRNGEFIGNTAGTAYNDKTAEPGYHEYYVEAFDNEGNNSLYSSSIYADNMPPQKPVLHLSEVTPMRISFKWDSEDNVEIDHFEVYKNGEFFKSTKSKELSDTTVTAGSEYSYYVIAIDTSNNVSEASDTKKITAKNDEEKPQIGIANQTLTENGKSLRIVCTDDVMLAEMNAEIKASSSEEWQSVKTQILSQKSQIINLDLSDYLTDSGEYDIRISVADAAGNTETVESNFTYAKNEMSEFEVTATADGCSVKLDWTSASDNSNVYYEIRRKDADGNEKYIATTRADELSYTDGGLYPLMEYSYFIVAHDENMYSVRSNTVNVTSGKDTIAPTARIKGNSLTIEGYSLSFDGSLSKDNFGVKSYSWNFGDESMGEGKTAEHTYSKAGTYTVTLTVADESGNTDSGEFVVTVYDKSYCIAEIQVLDENGRVLSDAAAYSELPDMTQSMYYADSDGIIPLVTKSGTYDFYFFADGYMPYKKAINLQGINTGNDRQKVTLTKDDLVTAEFEYEELDLDKAIELGIDVTAPENQHLNVVTIKVDNIESDDKHNFEVVVNQSGDFIQIESNGSVTVKDKVRKEKEETTSQGKTNTKTTISTLESGNKNNGDSQKSSPARDLTIKTMVSMSVTEFSWLKNFYTINISITNNAAEDFSIDDCSALFNLPDGLSLANTESAQSLYQSIGTIKGGTTKTISWIIKADKGGSHYVSVDFNGVLEPFGIPVNAAFESDAIVVKGNNALKLTLNSGTTRTNFELTNTAEYKVQNVKVDMGSYGEFKDADRIILKYPSGMMEIIEWEDDAKTKTKKTVYLPVGVENTSKLVESDYFDFRTLEPHESVIGIMYRNINTVS